MWGARDDDGSITAIRRALERHGVIWIDVAAAGRQGQRQSAGRGLSNHSAEKAHLGLRRPTTALGRHAARPFAR
jgi:hypothetical protein